jgi:hypothetical protein
VEDKRYIWSTHFFHTFILLTVEHVFHISLYFSVQCICFQYVFLQGDFNLLGCYSLSGLNFLRFRRIVGGPCPIPGQFMWDLWWTNCAATGFSPSTSVSSCHCHIYSSVTGFSPVTVIFIHLSPMLCTVGIYLTLWLSKSRRILLPVSSVQIPHTSGL